MKTTRKTGTWVLFGLYAAAMLYLLLFQRLGHLHFDDYWNYVDEAKNLIPLRSIVRSVTVIARRGLGSGIARFELRNLLGNVVLFVPLGLLLPRLFRRQGKFFWFLLTIVLLISAVEAVQLFTTLGSCDIDDLLLNVCGASLGYLFWYLDSRRQKGTRKRN